MAIGAISPLSSYMSTANVQPMNYAVENEAGYSAVYNTESVKSGDVVKGTSPVAYPNARVEEDEEARLLDPTAMLEEKKKVASEFNEIASQFKAGNTGYGKSGIGNSYGMAGSRFDAFA